MAQWQYQSKVEVLTTEKEQIFLDKWFVRTSEPVRDLTRWQYTYPGKFFFETPMDVVVTMDKWFQLFPERVERKENRSYVYPNEFIYIEPIINVVDLDSWFRQTSEPIRIKENRNWIYPSFTIDSSILTQGEQILVDKWFERTNEPVRISKNYNQIYPTFVIVEVPEQISLDKWFQPTSEPVRSKQDWKWAYPTWIVNAHLFDIPVVSYDPATQTFRSMYPDIIWNSPKRNWQYPYISFVEQTRCEDLWGPVHTSEDIIFLLPNGKLAKRLTDVVYLEM